MNDAVPLVQVQVVAPFVNVTSLISPSLNATIYTPVVPPKVVLRGALVAPLEGAVAKVIAVEVDPNPRPTAPVGLHVFDAASVNVML
jgi:hypothetical protein